MKPAAQQVRQGLSCKTPRNPLASNQGLTGNLSNRPRSPVRYPVPELDPPDDDPFAAVAIYPDAPEHYQRIYCLKRGEPVTRFAGFLAPRVIDLLEHIVGEGDVGIVASCGERESFAVLRLRDWEGIERAAAERGAKQ